MTATATETSQDAAATYARQANRALRMYLAPAAERVFESGALLNRIQEDALFRHLAYDSFEGYLAALQTDGVIARSTAYSNMKIARVFDPSKHAGIGIGRLRKLVDVPGAVAIAEEGLEVSDGAGGTVRRPVTTFKCRDLEKALKPLKVRAASADAPVTAGPTIDEINKAIGSLRTQEGAPTVEETPEPCESLEVGNNATAAPSEHQLAVSEQAPVPDMAVASTWPSSDLGGHRSQATPVAEPENTRRRPYEGQQQPFARDDDDLAPRTPSGVKRRGTSSSVA